MWFQDFRDGHLGGHLGWPNGTIKAVLNLYVAPMLPIRFRLNPTRFGRRSLRNFKMAAMAATLDIGTEKIAILNLYVAPMPPIKFWLNPTYGLEEVSFEEFQDGRHGGYLGYRNGTILAILNLYVALMPPITFQLNLTHGLVGDVVCWRPSWICERNHFSNSESPCHCDTSYQVLAQSDLRFGRRCRFEEFQDNGGHLGYQNGTILTFLISVSL